MQPIQSSEHTLTVLSEGEKVQFLQTIGWDTDIPMTTDIELSGSHYFIGDVEIACVANILEATMC